MGYNTDWLGMQRPIARLLGTAQGDVGDRIGLVVGAGKDLLKAHYKLRLNGSIFIHRRHRQSCLLCSEGFR